MSLFLQTHIFSTSYTIFIVHFCISFTINIFIHKKVMPLQHHLLIHNLFTKALPAFPLRQADYMGQGFHSCPHPLSTFDDNITLKLHGCLGKNACRKCSPDEFTTVNFLLSIVLFSLSLFYTRGHTICLCLLEKILLHLPVYVKFIKEMFYSKACPFPACFPRLVLRNLPCGRNNLYHPREQSHLP